jgi:hypothetical protein
MSGGRIVRHECGRLLIYGQRCVCDPIAPYTCDCTSSDNYEYQGDHCRQMRREAWSRAVNVARRTSRNST